jgi:predicted RNA-binding protein with RPS1 domain
MSIESVLADETSGGTSTGVTEPKVQINPDFGKMEDGQDISAESETTAANPPSQEGEPTASIADEPTEDSSEDASSSESSASAESQASASEGSQETVAQEAASEDASSEVASTEDATATADTAAAVASVSMPAIATEPMPRPSLIVDAEKLARSWQVGRAKLKSVAASLQFPFADVREFRYPVPLRSKVPSLDQLPQGTMLTALVVGVADFGVFVELGPDCSGLIHISRLASDFVEDPHMFVQIGDVIPVWVVQVDEKRKRVAVNAISPYSAERKRETNDERSGDRDRGPANRNSGDRNSGQRPARGNDRNDRGASVQAPRGAASGNAGPRGGTPRSGAPRSNDSGSGGRDQGQRRGGQPERGRGNFAGKGKPNRDRNEGETNENQGANRKPVRIDKPQPQKPITEAMQQGKEPLRSFGDLMQFIQKSKSPETDDAPRSVQGDSAAPAVSAPAAASDSPSSETPSSVASENDGMSEAGQSASDANTTA